MQLLGPWVVALWMASLPFLRHERCSRRSMLTDTQSQVFLLPMDDKFRFKVNKTIFSQCPFFFISDILK